MYQILTAEKKEKRLRACQNKLQAVKAIDWSNIFQYFQRDIQLMMLPWKEKKIKVKGT